MENNNKVWVRIDNRLIHGQIVETWVPYCKSKYIIVANDELCEDELRQEIMKLAIPADLRITFCSIRDIIKTVKNIEQEVVSSQIFILFATCEDAKKAFDRGLEFYTLNIGNLHYAPGKRQLCDHIFLSPDDITCLKYLKDQGINLDLRCVPNNPVSIKDEQLWD